MTGLDEIQPDKERLQREVARLYVSELYDIPLEELTSDSDARGYTISWWWEIIEPQRDGRANWKVSGLRCSKRSPRRAIVNLSRQIVLSGLLQFDGENVYPINLEEVTRSLLREKISTGEMIAVGCRFGDRRAKRKEDYDIQH